MGIYDIVEKLCINFHTDVISSTHDGIVVMVKYWMIVCILLNFVLIMDYFVQKIKIYILEKRDIKTRLRLCGKSDDTCIEELNDNFEGILKKCTQ